MEWLLHCQWRGTGGTPRHLEEAHGLVYASAVMHSSAVPFGWIIGCPTGSRYESR